MHLLILWNRSTVQTKPHLNLTCRLLLPRPISAPREDRESKLITSFSSLWSQSEVKNGCRSNWDGWEWILLSLMPTFLPGGMISAQSGAHPIKRVLPAKGCSSSWLIQTESGSSPSPILSPQRPDFILRPSLHSPCHLCLFISNLESKPVLRMQEWLKIKVYYPRSHRWNSR